jgi:hypothetical protein
MKRKTMTEDELQKKRQEFRDNEVQNKISSFTTAADYHQQTLKANYTHKVVKITIGKLGWTLIIGQATFLIFFSSLFFISYIPKAKFLITKVLP